MADRQYTDEWGARYEKHRVLLSRDFWMSVGFIKSDFENNETWQQALRRGPLNAGSVTTATQTEETCILEPIKLDSDEDSMGMVEMFSDVKEPLTIDTRDDPFAEFMDIGTPTYPGMEYNEWDIDVDLTTDEIFDDEEDDIILDMNKMGVCGVNLGLFLDDRERSRYIFQPMVSLFL
jgi:hypothetical protein